jgi:acyl carrier protein phosphodiesterase
VNYLGHLLVAPSQGLLTLGNLLGDGFKGRVAGIGPAELQLGVMLHRELDRYTDSHPAVLRAIGRLSPQRRRVAGALVDIFFDHFLANETDGLTEVLAREWALASDHVGHLPEPLRGLPERMLTSRWIGSYRSIEGLALVLVRMGQRRRFVLPLEGAEEELRLHYEALGEDFQAFFPDVVGFTKEAIPRLRDRQWASRAEPPEGGEAEAAWDLPETV